MNAIKTARKFIEAEPGHPDTAVLSHLVVALEAESEFPLAELYAMDLDHFTLALEIMRDWRLERYYKGRARLLAVSREVHEPEGGGMGIGT